MKGNTVIGLVAVALVGAVLTLAYVRPAYTRHRCNKHALQAAQETAPASLQEEHKYTINDYEAQYQICLHRSE